ncbi:LOW QUALITY PROTEIN: hypothetical protein ACHAW6_013702 [Cyclotella cf. meneghiniana]
MTRPRMDKFTWRFGKECMDFCSILANNLLQWCLKKDGCYELEHTPGLWKHKTCPIQFTLSMTLASNMLKKHTDHLVTNLKNTMKSNVLGNASSIEASPSSGINQ